MHLAHWQHRAAPVVRLAEPRDGILECVSSHYSMSACYRSWIVQPCTVPVTSVSSIRLRFDPQLQSSAKKFPIGIAAQVRERIYVGPRTGGGRVLTIVAIRIMRPPELGRGWDSYQRTMTSVILSAFQPYCILDSPTTEPGRRG